MSEDKALLCKNYVFLLDRATYKIFLHFFPIFNIFLVEGRAIICIKFVLPNFPVGKQWLKIFKIKKSKSKENNVRHTYVYNVVWWLIVVPVSWGCMDSGGGRCPPAAPPRPQHRRSCSSSWSTKLYVPSQRWNSKNWRCERSVSEIYFLFHQSVLEQLKLKKKHYGGENFYQI